MKFTFVAAGLALAGVMAGPALADPLPMDQPISVDGIETVCTGIGDEAQHDARWAAYPIRVEFSNGGAQYMAGAHVTLQDAGGKTLAAIDCSGSWVLFQIPQGSYKVFATMHDEPNLGERSATFTTPESGQKRVVIEFSKKQPNQ